MTAQDAMDAELMDNKRMIQVVERSASLILVVFGGAWSLFNTHEIVLDYTVLHYTVLPLEPCYKFLEVGRLQHCLECRHGCCGGGPGSYVAVKQ